MHIIYINTLVAYPTKVGSLIRKLPDELLYTNSTAKVKKNFRGSTFSHDIENIFIEGNER